MKTNNGRCHTHRTIPHRLTVTRSNESNTRFSTSNPIRITTTNPANTLSVYNSLRF
ncbi:hypothetical protein D3C72_899170 [compost metagenome]